MGKLFNFLVGALYYMVRTIPSVRAKVSPPRTCDYDLQLDHYLP